MQTHEEDILIFAAFIFRPTLTLYSGGILISKNLLKLSNKKISMQQQCKNRFLAIFLQW